METTHPFLNISRIGEDQCYIDQKQIQNTAECNYLLQNYFTKDCSMKDAKSLATMQPGINFVGGYGVGANGYNIDDNSRLFLGTIQTHPRCHIDLFQRPFATVPLLARGYGDSIMESNLQQGLYGTNRRSKTGMAEKRMFRYQYLIPDVKDKITNPNFLIEESASDGKWIRGGVPSRELTKDTSYYQKN
uniref:Uncharacterized protein n=1 Tax=viral metagenome TaxID=1070528 RepID=A0A6C0H5L3_9ZZZZ